MNRLTHLAYIDQTLQKMPLEYWQCIFPKCVKIPANDSGLCWQHFCWFENELVLTSPTCVENDCTNLKALGQELCNKHISIYNMRSFRDSKFNATREIAKLCMKNILEKELRITIERVTLALIEKINVQVDYELSNRLITKCDCCLDTFKRNELIVCSNNHGFCVECVQRYILNISNISLKCMVCDGCLDIDDLRMCLSIDTYTKFCLAMDIKEVAELSKVVDDYQICPFCISYGCIVETFRGHITCQKCNLTWCSGCRRKTHRGDCFTIDISDNIETVDKMIQEIITDGLSHKCPRCKTKYFREDGCNHIKCPKCDVDSCYVCGDEISGIFVYKHYEDSKGLCKLYTEVDRTPFLLKELGRFINDNPANRTLIYERLKIICKTDKVLIKKIKSLKIRYNIQNTSDSECCIN